MHSCSIIEVQFFQFSWTMKLFGGGTFVILLLLQVIAYKKLTVPSIRQLLMKMHLEMLLPCECKSNSSRYFPKFEIVSYEVVYRQMVMLKVLVHAS